MKKIYVLAMTMMSLNVNSQIYTVDFENALTASESYDNGSAGAGDFNFDDLEFGNYYNAGWSSYGGFAFSNITDVTTAGYTNQYASSTGNGNNSDTYGIFYWDGYSPDYINAINNKSIDSFYINTTTYSRLSMLNGDAVGKQFGSPLNAQGMDDETAGADFLKVWIISSLEDGSNKDSMEFFLADYRFADDNDDYIVNEWTKVDLSSLTTYPKQVVKFRFESSDVGQFGINTPTYFAIDDVSYHQMMGVNEIELNVEVYPNPAIDFVSVNGEQGNLSLKDVNGKVILSEAHMQFTKFDLSKLPQGIYFLTLENERGKAVRKIVK
ncbi:MAG: DUF4465 domain-containing protein [Bacteroidota bacterium]